jgi:predicted HTH domain antitoxin
MTSVTIQLPDEIPRSLHRSPIELEKDIRLAAAIDWYRQGLISQGRAAELAGHPASRLSGRVGSSTQRGDAR